MIHLTVRDCVLVLYSNFYLITILAWTFLCRCLDRLVLLEQEEGIAGIVFLLAQREDCSHSYRNLYFLMASVIHTLGICTWAEFMKEGTHLNILVGTQTSNNNPVKWAIVQIYYSKLDPEPPNQGYYPYICPLKICQLTATKLKKLSHSTSSRSCLFLS